MEVQTPVHKDGVFALHRQVYYQDAGERSFFRSDEFSLSGSICSSKGNSDVGQGPSRGFNITDCT